MVPRLGPNASEDEHRHYDKEIARAREALHVTLHSLDHESDEFCLNGRFKHEHHLEIVTSQKLGFPTLAKSGAEKTDATADATASTTEM